jgi:Gamma-aminobutyrate permease and related permeases
MDKNNDKYLTAYSLTGIGIGSLIGAGFFLGLSIAINQAGPSVILAFLIGGAIMSQVLGAMTSISINRETNRTFRYYTEKLLGQYIGTLLGWIVFISGVLTICSEALASAIFIKYWFPNISITFFAFLSLLIVIVINAMGIKNLSIIESGISLVKILILLTFIFFGIRFITSNGISVSPNPFSSIQAFFPKGFFGTIQSMLIVIFTYGGISAIAMASSEVKNPKKEVPKATLLITLGIIILYTVSAAIITMLLEFNSINTNESPFVTALSKIGIGYASAIINIAILVSTISVMLASFYSCTRMLISISKTNKIFSVFTISTPHNFYRNAWALVSIISLLIVGLSYLVSSKLFNYLVSASSYFSLFNWFINLTTYLVWRKRYNKEVKYHSPLLMGKIGAYLASASIVFLFILSLWVEDFRIGFYISITIGIIISVIYFVRHNFNKKRNDMPVVKF